MKDITWGYIFSYFGTPQSLFRYFQNRFLKEYGKNIEGGVIEIGGEKKYGHSKYFPHAASYRCTNIRRDCDFYLDATAMNLPDDSQDGYVCVSVLEHIYELHKAVQEINRTLKSGGKLLLVVPFAYAQHDEVDYWRLSEDAYDRLFSKFEIKAFVHLGGRLSSIATVLQRPRGNLRPRYFLYKLVGFFIIFMAKFLEVRDGFPLGYGIYAVKKL